jgi:competence protein ComEA
VPASRPIMIAVTAAAATALALAALAFATRPGSSGAIDVRLPEAATATPGDGQIKAYITGAVQRPGVYTVRSGDRVADLVEAAGGPTDDADTSAVNFARRIRDEDQVIVPRRGEVLASPVPIGGTAARRIDINSATSATLETLPGIGPTRARNIVESRAKDGPFTTTTELVKRKLLPQSVYDGIKELIDVHP